MVQKYSLSTPSPSVKNSILGCFAARSMDIPPFSSYLSQIESRLSSNSPQTLSNHSKSMQISPFQCELFYYAPLEKILSVLPIVNFANDSFSQPFIFLEERLKYANRYL